MSVNLVYGIDQTKVKKYGRYFGSIDFHVASPTKSAFDRLGKSIHAGTLCIDNRQYRLTLEQIDDLVVEMHTSGEVKIFSDTWEFTRYEVDRVIETLKAAKHVLFQKYRFGM